MTQRRAVHAGPPPIGPYSPAILAGGMVFVSGILASDAAGRITGDITAQTRRVLDRLKEVLDASGSDLAHAVTVHVYLRKGEDFAAMNAVYQTYWKDQPPSRTTVVVDLLGPETLIEVSAVAVPAGGKRMAINPPGWAQSPLPYSYCVRAGDALYLAGLVARDRLTNQPVEGTVAEQVDVIMANAREILGAAGLSLDHVCSARVFLSDAASFVEMNAGWRRHFARAKPARATIIAGLMQPAYKIEVTLVAHGAQAEHLPAEPPSENLSGAVKAGNMLFLSGALAPGAADATVQTRETLMKLRATLERAGASVADVVETTVWLPDLADFAAMNAAYREVFTDAPPARATVGAPLVAKDARVEIALTVIR
ncbi:MAG: RidA family protein [Acidobacteriota bacterium]|nr:RidA family protein [Acidobacteriota bacterium]